jgi:hypothetical protein
VGGVFSTNLSDKEKQEVTEELKKTTGCQSINFAEENRLLMDRASNRASSSGRPFAVFSVAACSKCWRIPPAFRRRAFSTKQGTDTEEEFVKLSHEVSPRTVRSFDFASIKARVS